MTTLLAAFSRSQSDLAVHVERFIARHAGSYVGLERIAVGWTKDGKLFVSGSGLAVLDVCPALRDKEVSGCLRMCRSMTVQPSMPKCICLALHCHPDEVLQVQLRTRVVMTLFG